MPAIRYHEIVDTLKLILETHQRTADAKVFIETDPALDVVGAQKAIMIVLDKRKPHDDQPIAAGKRTRYLLEIGVWAIGFAIDLTEAARIRDELVGEIELVLMENRTIRDKVTGSYLMGGNFITANAEKNIFSMAETILVADVMTTLG